LRSVAYGCASYTDVAAVGQGKMWDCKTSKMSQSPHAALNAFGLFATGLLGEHGHTAWWEATPSRDEFSHWSSHWW